MATRTAVDKAGFTRDVSHMSGLYKRGGSGSWISRRRRRRRCIIKRCLTLRQSWNNSRMDQQYNAYDVYILIYVSR